MSHSQLHRLWRSHAPCSARRRAGRRGAPTLAGAPRGPALRHAPSRLVGGYAASARSGRLQTPGRVSQRLGGARLGPGWGPSGPGGVAPTGARSPTPGLLRPRLAGPRPRWPGLVPYPLALRVGAHGLGPVQAASDAQACLPAPRGSKPRAGPGNPRGLARQPPACAALAWPARVPASFSFTRLERRRIKPWHAPQYCQAAYCDSDIGVRPVGHSQRAFSGTAAPVERHLQVTRRPPLASHPRRDGAPAPEYGRPTAGRRPGLGSFCIRSWRSGEGPATVRFAC